MAADTPDLKKEPSMNDTLPTEFRQTLANLEMLSHGGTSGWNKSSPPSDPDRSPHGESFPPHEEHLIDWYCQTDNLGRRRVMREARQALEHWSRRTIPAKPKLEPIHERNDEIRKTGAGWEASEVARHFRIPVREVIEIRKRAGLDPSTGRQVRVGESKRVRVLRLLGEGLSQSEIAVATGSSRQSVSQMLKRAA